MEKADIFPVAHIGTAACVSVISVWWTLLLTVNRQIQLTHMRSFSHFLHFSLSVCVCVCEENMAALVWCLRCGFLTLHRSRFL